MSEWIKEAGNVRFEVYRHQDDPTRLIVLEIYRDEDALKFHGESEYVQAWRAAVKAYTDEYTKVMLSPVFTALEG